MKKINKQNKKEAKKQTNKMPMTFFHRTRTNNPKMYMEW